MLELSLLEGRGRVATRSFATCLASLTETQPARVPLPTGSISAAVPIWRQWLAARGLGLVELPSPQTFNWPGYWIAVIDAGSGSGAGSGSRGDAALAVLMFGTPAGVVLSPGAAHLLGRTLPDVCVTAGYVVAALDPAAAAPQPRAGAQGVVEAVAIAPRATAAMQLLSEARALARRGLEGDRYAEHAGTFSSRNPALGGYDLTLIEADVLDVLVLPGGVRVGYADARRNVVTRGVSLNSLVGRRFLVGDVECLGQRLCEPCAHLERLTSPGALKALIHRGGLRADVLSDGTISPGAAVRTLP